MLVILTERLQCRDWLIKQRLKDCSGENEHQGNTDLVTAGRKYHARTEKQEKKLVLSESKSLEKKHGGAESQTFEGRAQVSLCWYLRGWNRIPNGLGLRPQRSRYCLAGTSEGVR